MKTIMGLKKPLCICIFLCLGIGELFTKIGGGEKVYGAQKESRYLTEIEVNAEAEDSYSEAGKYDQTFYNEIISRYDSDYNSSEQALIIRTQKELASFAKAVNDESKSFEGKYVKLAADIDLEGEQPIIRKSSAGDTYKLVIGNSQGQAKQKITNTWIPIGKDSRHTFKGTFDGNQKEIRGMVVLNESTDRSGFFGYISGGNIKNLKIDKGYVISNLPVQFPCAGGLVGRNSRGIVSGSHFTGMVAVRTDSGMAYAGGLAGDNDRGTIENSDSAGEVFCYHIGTRIANSWGGGLAGYNNKGTIRNCHAAGDVSVWSKTVSMAGGLAAYNSGGAIEKSSASGNTFSFTSESTKAFAGGLIAYNDGPVKSSLALGDSAAAIDSSAPKSVSYAGGLIGENSDATGIIEESCATGSVSFLNSRGTAAYGGGLIGWSHNNANIKNSCATGNVTDASYGGGLTGYNEDSMIESSYAAGDVTAVYGGGLVSYNDKGTIRNCCRNSEARIMADKDISNQGKSITPQQMTGTGIGRADQSMPGFDQSIWSFTKDGAVYRDSGKMYLQNLYYPRLKSIVYPTGKEPRYIRKIGYSLKECIEVKVTGIIADGSILTAQVSDKRGAPAAVKGTQRYQWYVDNKMINGAVKNTYRIRKGEAGKPIKVVVTAPSFFGQAEASAVRTSGVRLSKKEMILYKGKTSRLTARITPSDASETSVRWTSSNSKIAKVDSAGKVTAKGYGRAVIKASAKDSSGKYSTCKVTVPYRIRYVLNKGKNLKSNPAYYYNQSITLKKPFRKGYYFKGWYQDKKLKKKISKIKKGTKKNYKIYAKWSKVKAGSTWMYNLRNKKSRTITFQWRKVKGASGYQIKYAGNKKFRKAKTIYRKGTRATLKKLKPGKKYYIRVRAYKIDSAGKKVYGTYSKAMSWRVW